jgi:dolichol-phosphate mannosyltransferase
MMQGESDRISDFGFRIADSGCSDNPQSAIRNPQFKTLVALATYNEIENLPSLVDAILCVLPDSDVLVVDDNSPDGTGKWCEGRASTEPRLRCLHRPRKMGLGSATLEAAQIAIDGGYDVFITLDADWSHDPTHLPQMLGALERADVAIGSRYASGGAIEGWPWHRRVMSRSLNRMSRALLGLPIRDSSGAFRAYRVGKLKEIKLASVQSGGYAYLEEIIWHLHRAGASFAEVPIIFHERRAGRSKVSAHEALDKLRMVLRLRANRYRLD